MRSMVIIPTGSRCKEAGSVGTDRTIGKAPEASKQRDAEQAQRATTVCVFKGDICEEAQTGSGRRLR